MNAKAAVETNGRLYPFPKVPVIAICLDGCEPDYLDRAIEDGLMPCLARIRETGTDRLADAVVPTFTNPNNLSIATGVPPSVHGICGNFLFDPVTGEEVMMNDVRFLRTGTIFRDLQNAGARVGIVTAKDKLRALLGAGLTMSQDRGRCFSAERCDSTTVAEHGIENASAWLGRPRPEVYSGALSEFVFAAGVKLLREWSPDVLYLTTSDYIQHKFAPEDSEAKAFYAMFDRYLAAMDAAGAVIVLTADHGMKPKHLADGSPCVVYAQDLLDGWLGRDAARVILPITDPYVVHHGALGSYATAYLPSDADVDAIIGRFLKTKGITHVLTRDEAVSRFELPADRIGDIVMISGTHVCIGTSRDRHDLQLLREPLRSHGGLTEQVVPFIVNRVVDIPDEPRLRNFDAFFHATAAAAA